MGYKYDDGLGNIVKPHAVKFTSDGKTYTYDANGNMTSEVNIAAGFSRMIDYNFDNMPMSVTLNGVTTTFVYDGAGARVKKTTSTGTSVYIGKLYECKGGACSKYIFAGGSRVALKSATDTLYYHQDHLGSTRLVTDQTGQVKEQAFYLPFGSAFSDTGALSVSHKYTGQEFDAETGLYYYNARYYNPVLGRFISADTIVPDPTNPQALNRYSYVVNNPLIYTDPSGHGLRRWIQRNRDRIQKVGRVAGWVFAPQYMMYIDPETRGAAISGTVAFFLSGGNPAAAVGAAASNAFLNNTGSGRKLTQKVAKEIFVDVFGMHPKYAYMASYATLNFTISTGVEELYKYAAQMPSADVIKNTNKETPEWVKENEGHATGAGRNVTETMNTNTGEGYNLIYEGEQVAAVGADDVEGSWSFMGHHTTAVARNADGIAYTSMTGIPRLNVFGLNVTCQQMTNQAIFSAGYANTVLGSLGYTGAGISSYTTFLLYGNYGGIHGFGPAGLMHSYIETERYY